MHTYLMTYRPYATPAFSLFVADRDRTIYQILLLLLLLQLRNLIHLQSIIAPCVRKPTCKCKSLHGSLLQQTTFIGLDRPILLYLCSWFP